MPSVFPCRRLAGGGARPDLPRVGKLSDAGAVEGGGAIDAVEARAGGFRILAERQQWGPCTRPAEGGTGLDRSVVRSVSATTSPGTTPHHRHHRSSSSLRLRSDSTRSSTLAWCRLLLLVCDGQRPAAAKATRPGRRTCPRTATSVCATAASRDRLGPRTPDGLRRGTWADMSADNGQRVRISLANGRNGGRTTDNPYRKSVRVREGENLREFSPLRGHACPDRRTMCPAVLPSDPSHAFAISLIPSRGGRRSS
jgi:hypothetical protein